MYNYVLKCAEINNEYVTIANYMDSPDCLDACMDYRFTLAYPQACTPSTTQMYLGKISDPEAMCWLENIYV